MRQPSTLRSLAGAVALAAAAGCSRPAPAPPPAREFLVSAGDSTYWVQSSADGLRLRGSPIVLSRLDGRFYELYVADDDRSFPDAVFVGQRLFRRDIMTGDSSLVLEDSLVPRLAREYAASHPDEQPLEAGEEGNDEPSTHVTSAIDLVDVHGPYLSYEYHVDVERNGRSESHGDGTAWHSTRRGVLNLRRGREETVAGIFGDSAAERVIREGREAYAAAIVSVQRAQGNGARRLARALRRFQFDPASFQLTDVDGGPAVIFHAPGQGPGTAGSVTLPLPPISAAGAGWWRDLLAELPTPSPDSMVDRWERDGVVVLARYDSLGQTAELVVRDSASREWRLGRVGAPVNRVIWLDAGGGFDSRTRSGLARAFEEAALYDESVRTAAGPARGGDIFPVRPASQTRGTNPLSCTIVTNGSQDAARVRGRGRRSDDAAPGQRAAAPLHLRGRGAEHGGPGCGAGRDAPRRRSGDHALHRPGAVQGAHPRG